MEVLRLSAALDELRSTARQDAKSGEDREAALQSLLASETEVRIAHTRCRCIFNFWCVSLRGHPLMMLFLPFLGSDVPLSE